MTNDIIRLRDAIVGSPPRRIGIFLRIKLWYNGVCIKHLVYKEAPGHPDGGLFCTDCRLEKNERHALKKQALDNLIVELKRGR